MTQQWPQIIRNVTARGITPGPHTPERPIEEAGTLRPAEIDDELAAQKECYDALMPLDSQARARVLRWLAETLEVAR